MIRVWRETYSQSPQFLVIILPNPVETRLLGLSLRAGAQSPSTDDGPRIDEEGKCTELRVISESVAGAYTRRE